MIRITINRGADHLIGSRFSQADAAISEILRATRPT